MRSLGGMLREWSQHIAATAIVLGVGIGSAFAQADLSLTFVGGPNGVGCAGVGSGCGGNIPIAPGGQAVYELTVVNNGPASADGVIVTATFPPGTSIAGPGSLPIFGCSSSIVAGSPTVTCTQASLPIGGSIAVAIGINLAPDYPWQDGLAATATVTSSTPDPVSANDTVTENLVVQAPLTTPALDPRALAVLIVALAFVGSVARR